MRIWDLSPALLCRQHLLGEHRELHALWSILTQNKKGYRFHPETRRWQNKLKALYLRHKAQVKEFSKRDWQHHSDLDSYLATESTQQTDFVDTIKQQKQILKNKNCSCLV